MNHDLDGAVEIRFGPMHLYIDQDKVEEAIAALRHHTGPMRAHIKTEIVKELQRFDAYEVSYPQRRLRLPGWFVRPDEVLDSSDMDVLQVLLTILVALDALETQVLH